VGDSRSTVILGSISDYSTSHQTVYMDEEDVRQDEQAWVKSFFTIDTEPSSDLVQAAVRRQKIRTGFRSGSINTLIRMGRRNSLGPTADCQCRVPHP